MLPNTKKDFQEMLFTILNPTRSHYSQGKALLKLGNTGTKYDERCAQMEGFARTFWGLAPFFKGGGIDDEFLLNCITGLENGTNPEHEEYWGGFGEIDQRFCEMAALATGLLLIPEKLWDPLPQKAKDNLVNWLLNINHYTLGPNNWQFFSVLVNTALKKLGVQYSQDAMELSFERIESYYLGDGWYQDGRLRSKDYYISFAFHFYGLLYAKLMEKEDPERCELYRKRASRFAEDYIYWFDDKGEAVAYGRSLTYRFAQSAFFSACLFSGIEPIPMAVMKGILARHLERWMNAPIFDNAGVLSIGYKYPNLIMAENYNAPGSPMWSLKAFLFLALPDDHLFWQIEAAPMPKLDIKKSFPIAEKIIVREEDSVTMYPTGAVVVAAIQGHMAEKYCKFAYSSKYGFSVQSNSDILESLAPDSTLVFEVDGHFYPRLQYSTFEIDDDKIITRWSPLKSIQVTTTIEPYQGGHIRRHLIQSEVDCTAYDCGFAIPKEAAEYKESIGENEVSICYNEGFCTVKGGEGIVIGAQPNTNLMAQRTSIPAVKYSITSGETRLETIVSYQ